MRTGGQFLLILLLVSVCSSCSDTMIDPFENEEKLFTIWGYLDQLSADHAVRVVPVTRFPENILSPTDPQAQIDAEVYSTDLTSGERIRWNHELSQLEDGTYGHVFKSHFLLNPRRGYRLEVIRADGKMAYADTRVPGTISDTLLVKHSVVWENDSTMVYQDFDIPGIPSPWDIKMYYWWEGGTAKQGVYVPYNRQGSRTNDGGWRIRANISEDQPAVWARVQWAQDTGLLTPTGTHHVFAMGIQIRILDGNWDPPLGVFDPEILAQPGVLSNVVGGHGFFGSVGLYAQEWSIEDISKSLGYPY
jgi:hypothetical protein